MECWVFCKIKGEKSGSPEKVGNADYCFSKK